MMTMILSHVQSHKISRNAMLVGAGNSQVGRSCHHNRPWLGMWS